jgi:hypothetical protein
MRSEATGYCSNCGMLGVLGRFHWKLRWAEIIVNLCRDCQAKLETGYRLAGYIRISPFHEREAGEQGCR